MIKKDKNILKNKKRIINTPGILQNKKIQMFGEQKKNLPINRPKSKNIVKNNEKNYNTHFGFYLKRNDNQKPLNLLNNNINNIYLNKNKQNLQIKKDAFSEEKNNNKKIFLKNNFNDNKKAKNNNNILINTNLSQSQKKKNINLNNQNVMNKLFQENDFNKNNKIIFQNRINVIKIQENKNRNLNDIFPKIKKIPKIKEPLLNLDKSNKFVKVHKSNDLNIMLDKNNNRKRKIKVILPNSNKNNLININNNKHNLNKNIRYVLKNSPIKKDDDELINVNKNIFNNNKQNKLVFKLNINNNINNINMSNKINNGKSNDNYILKKNNNILANRNILLQRNDLNKYNLKLGSFNEEKISNTSSDNFIHLKDYFSREEMNPKFKESMEDFLLIKHPFLSIEKHNLSLFSVFDGHGGNFVAKYLKENFASNLQNNIKINYSMNFRNILKSTFESTDKELEKFNEAENCGSTGTVVIINNNAVYCANVGDSKCYFINKTNNIIQLSEDHNCNNQKDREELKKKGVLIFQNRVFGSLSLTRTFGDKEFKKEGLTCNPYIKKIFLDKDDVKYIIIASDGIWDIINEEKLGEIYKGLHYGTSKDFSNKLVDYAIENGSIDNISCIVIRF